MSGTRHFTCDKGETFTRTVYWATSDPATDPERTLGDLVTDGTTTIVSATANFTSTDVGREITGTNIPAKSYIVSRTNATTVVINAAAAAGTGGQLKILSTRRVSLTGYTAKLQVRRTATHPDVLVELTHSAGLTLGGAAGTIVITISAATTAAIEAGKWVYDLQLTSGASAVKYLLSGRFQVIETTTV